MEKRIHGPWLRKVLLGRKGLVSMNDFSGIGESFPAMAEGRVRDPYRCHAWVNIAISILIRNIARATFQIVLNGKPAIAGRVFDLFRDVNPKMNRFDLWKETSAWWFLEGEAFWYFGNGYSAGIPKELYVLNPRKLMAFAPLGKVEKWYYSTAMGTVSILPDELIHFQEWNPWNEIRGVMPLVALGEEIEQDVRSNRSTTKLMGNNAIPEGILKTDQMLRKDEAEQLEEKWESIYGKGERSRSIAVLGKGSEFQHLTFTPQAMRYLDLKRWNVHAILARYGIPLHTRMIMALKQAGVALPFPEDKQPEDYLTQFLRQREAYEKMRELTPWFFDKESGAALYPPNEVHVMLAWGVNTLLQKKVVRFSTEVPVEKMFAHLEVGGGVVLSGVFPLSDGSNLHHVVLLAGTITDGEKTTGVIIDDPFGDWRSDYRDCRGNDVEMSLEEFNKVFRPCGNIRVKWGHLVG